jgi:hypothetical protein
MTSMKTPISISDIRPDASLYSPEAAASLYVDHPEGLPTLDRNSLIVGPIGSGKTIMLKALYAKWSIRAELTPIYVDISRWTAQIAGETYGSDRISPRSGVVLQAMSLAVVLGLLESIDAFTATSSFPSLWTLFEEAFETSDPFSIRTLAKRNVKNALITGEQLSPHLPTVFTVGNTLGADVSRMNGSKLVLLVDQIDQQISSMFFSPTASLLRRSSDYISVLAMRPCPTAPDPEEIPLDITAGDSYRIIQLGRSASGSIPHSFVRQFIQALPLVEPFRAEIEDRAALIGNLMWPSLRFAINTITQYVRLRIVNTPPDQSWYQSIREIAANYEDIVQDGLRAWCANPRTMVKDWRRRIIAKRGSHPVPLGRSILSFSRRSDLFGEIKSKSSQHLIRIAVKKGILLMGAQEHYIPGTVPTVCEMAPLLLVNDPNVDLERFDPAPVTVDIAEETLEKWTRTYTLPSRTHKRIFVSYWMSDPKQDEREGSLVEIVTKKFGSAVEITTGRLIGSPRWSPEIIANISKVDLVLCDLSVPRRDIFVEYGVAIGQHIPLIQCFANPAKESGFPGWVKNRQNQYFAASAMLNRRFETSVAAFLQNKPDAKGSWKRDSAGRTLDSPRDPRNIVVIGPSTLVQ